MKVTKRILLREAPGVTTRAMKSTIPKRLQAVIDERKLSREALAVELGCSLPTLYRWLRVPPDSVTKRAAIERALDGLEARR